MEVEALLRQDYSPEQVSGRLRLEGGLLISHETFWLDGATAVFERNSDAKKVVA